MTLPKLAHLSGLKPYYCHFLSQQHQPPFRCGNVASAPMSWAGAPLQQMLQHLQLHYIQASVQVLSLDGGLS